MSWYNPISWFKKKNLVQELQPSVLEYQEKGTCVEVRLHYGFGQIVPCEDIGNLPGFRPLLHISDLSCEETRARLEGKRLNWAIIPLSILSPLELEPNIHKIKWDDLKKYLRDWLD